MYRHVAIFAMQELNHRSSRGSMSLVSETCTCTLICQSGNINSYVKPSITSMPFPFNFELHHTTISYNCITKILLFFCAYHSHYCQNLRQFHALRATSSAYSHIPPPSNSTPGTSMACFVGCTVGSNFKLFNK